MGCERSRDRPSMVVTKLPSSAEIGTRQQRTALPSTWTMQAPQWPVPQPYLVPVRLEASRSAHSKGRRGVHPIVDGLAVHGKAAHARSSRRGRAAMGSERIAVGIEGGVAHVELARADKFNAMDKDMFAAIGDTFRALGRDPDGARDPAVRPGQAFHRRARPRICREPVRARRRCRARGRGQASPYRMAAGRVQRGRAGARAGDRGDPWRLHRRRRRPRHRLRPARRRRRRLLPDRRGRRRDHRRSRHAAAARLSDPAGRAARADLYRPPDGGGGGGALRPRQPDRGGPRGGDRRRPRARRGPSPPSRRSRSPAPRRASTTAAAARSRRACATSPCGMPGRWPAPDIGEAVRARLGKTEPSFAPLDD